MKVLKCPHCKEVSTNSDYNGDTDKCICDKCDTEIVDISSIEIVEQN